MEVLQRHNEKKAFVTLRILAVLDLGNLDAIQDEVMMNRCKCVFITYATPNNFVGRACACIYIPAGSELLVLIVEGNS